MKYTRKNEIKKKHLVRKIPFQKRHTKIKRKKPKKKSQKKIQKGGWPPKGNWNQIFTRTNQLPVQKIAGDTQNNPRFQLYVDFETPDAGYFDLVNSDVANFLQYCLDYAKSNGKTITDILWQTEPFKLFGKNIITITVKLFGINNTPRDYTKNGMTWDEIGCDAYGATNLGITQLKIKGVPCSRGNTERRIFFNIPGNFFHYILALNKGEIKIKNHILFFHIAHYMFKKNDGSHFLVHIHNEDVPWFHIKAVANQGADIPLIKSNNSSRNIGMAPSIYGTSIQSIPSKLFESFNSGINDTMSGIVGQTLQSNFQPNIKHSIPEVVLARGMSFDQNQLQYIIDKNGQFNMDIWFKRLSNSGSESFWSLSPRVACSYSTGGHGFEPNDNALAQEINTKGKICVVVLAYFDFTGKKSSSFDGEKLPPSIIFETDNKNNDPIGGRPSNTPNTHVSDYASIANLIGLPPAALNVSGNSTFAAGEKLCSTLNKNKTFAPNNVGGYFVPHNLAQFVLCSESYQYLAHLEAYVYNSLTGDSFKAVFPIQMGRPMPGKRVPWVKKVIHGHGNNNSIQSASNFITRVSSSMSNLITIAGLPPNQYSMFGKTGHIGNKSSFGMTLLRDIKNDPLGKKYLAKLKDNFDTLLAGTQQNNPGAAAVVPGIDLVTLQKYNNVYDHHYSKQGLSPDLLQMFFNALDKGNKNYLTRDDWSNIP